MNALSGRHASPAAQPATQQPHEFHKAGHLGGEFDLRHRPAID
jgi:hypothetical protein